MRETIWAYLGSEEWEASRRPRPGCLRKGFSGAGGDVGLCACVFCGCCVVVIWGCTLVSALERLLVDDASVDADVVGVLQHCSDGDFWFAFCVCISAGFVCSLSFSRRSCCS